jgi:small-conductance mechanosensitive channel
MTHGADDGPRSTGRIAAGMMALATATALLVAPARGQTPEVDAIKKVVEASTKSAAPAGAGDAADAKADAPPKGKLDEQVAETEGPISVTETVNDAHLLQRLEQLLPKYPGVRSIHVEVEDGVVTLQGHVRDDEVRDRLRDFVRRVEGVSLVINQARTDPEVFTAPQRARAQIERIASAIAHGWLLWILAVATALGSLSLARLFGRYGETILTPFTGNTLLRSVLVSVVTGSIVLAGALGALSILGLTETVLPGLGLAGVVALAIGFAFRDITENFIASILLGTRRPFRQGDYVEVSKYAGVVRTLNTRATVLVTLEGHQVRIPNSIVFKEVLVNKSASTSTRNAFDVVIPYEASTAAAQEAISKALQGQDGVLADPPARSLVEALEPDGVRLRVYFWAPTQGVDGLKLMSDAKLKAKVALQERGITPSPRLVAATLSGGLAPDAHAARPAPARAGTGTATPGAAAVIPGGAAAAPANVAAQAQARANLRRDQHAAATAEATGPQADQDHALRSAREEVTSEGQNLICDKESKACETDPAKLAAAASSSSAGTPSVNGSSAPTAGS